MDERDRTRLNRLLGTLVSAPHEREKVADDCEGRFDSLASYVERRLMRELPPDWRWICTYVAHAAVGERWQEERRIVALADEGTPRISPGIWVFLGKG